MPRKKSKITNANKRQYYYNKKFRYPKKYLTIDKKKINPKKKYLN